jgi:cytochrome b561
MPQPIVNTVADWNMAISHGVTGAVYTLAGAMLLSGLAVIVVSVRKQRLAASAAPSPAPAPPSHSEPA